MKAGGIHFLTMLGVVAGRRAWGGRADAGSPGDINCAWDLSCEACCLRTVVLVRGAVDGGPKGSCGIGYCPRRGRG